MMKKLGFGLMRLPLRNPADPADIDLNRLCEMVDAYLDKGFTYFDTAWMYNGFMSEKAAKKVLTDRVPRDRFTLATKLHSAFFRSREEMDRLFDTQLENTGAGYFDYYLLHGIEDNTIRKYEKYDGFGWMREKKEQGLIRRLGFSYHGSPEVLDEILTRHPETEFVQLQINYLDWDSPWIKARACYETAVRHGKPVFVMEPVKGGTLAALPEEAEAILRALDPALSPPPGQSVLRPPSRTWRWSCPA